MEKINDRQVKIDKMNPMNSKKYFLLILLLFAATFALPRQAEGQIRAGVGYLKMLHGAREVGAMGTMTAALDHTYSFYANPGATGLLREWQWSATYTNWISDVYNASFLFGRKIAMPWSRETKFLLGVNYLGIPEFNNTDEAGTLVSGNNLVVTASVGQPLSWITSNLSLGGNIKYFNSKLAQFDSDAFIFDFGLLYRTPRIHFQTLGLGLVDYIIFSGGISATNLGRPVTFISEETPLPGTFRGGVAANLGRHHGLQLSLGLDYREVRDEDGFFTFGSEISWRQLISLRLGYSWEENLLGNFTFGGSIRLDDRVLNHALVGRNNALRLDLATNENNNVVDSPYHGTITHQPIGPERFRLLEPAYNQRIDSDSVMLKWEMTRDPDLYDDVEQWLVVDRDSSKLAHLVEKAKNNQNNIFEALKDLPLLVNQSVHLTRFMVNHLRNGDYYWTVFAYDKDYHIRLGRMNRHQIAKFHVTAPDPRVIAIKFDYSPWITQDDYQGVLNFMVINFGDRTAHNFLLSINDSSLSKTDSRLLYDRVMPDIEPGDTVQIELDWSTRNHGLHQIKTNILKPGDQKNIVNQFAESFYTIPKGIFGTQDTVIIQTYYTIIYDIPYLGKIFFDSSSAEVKDRYIDDWVIEPPLSVFARRLQENPSVKIYLQGTIDPNSGETDAYLADQRAAAVRDSLHSLGVGLDQMMILNGIKLDRRRLPKNSEDRRWVLEERRRVDITTSKKNEEILFKPLQTTYIQKTNFPVIFESNISGIVPFQTGQIFMAANQLHDSLEINDQLENARLVKDINWHLDQPDADKIDQWLTKDVEYSLTLTDSLIRTFKTKPRQTYLNSEVSGRERRYYVLAKFDSAKAYYDFYWTNLINTVPYLLEDEQTRMCFHGHGCATGPERINNPLSKKRANYFQDNFLRDVQQKYPDRYDEIKQRIDPPRGAGESEPLEFRTEDGTVVILGDNNTPLGRQLNRRVMIFFYTVK